MKLLKELYARHDKWDFLANGLSQNGTQVIRSYIPKIREEKYYRPITNGKLNYD